MVTYPNQKIITVHKPKYSEDFLQISKEEWMEAYSKLTRSGLGLYLYCSGNQNTYQFALSSQAIQVALGISDSSYRRAVEELLVKGYLIEGSGNMLHFHTTPQPTTYVPKPKKPKKTPSTADAALIFDETPAARPDDTTPANMLPRSFSPDLEYSWED